ncbi:MAG: hypothetical protein AAFU49_00575 [Pseudomonadota bacterium]
MRARLLEEHGAEMMVIVKEECDRTPTKGRLCMPVLEDCLGVDVAKDRIDVFARSACRRRYVATTKAGLASVISPAQRAGTRSTLRVMPACSTRSISRRARLLSPVMPGVMAKAA